MIKNRIIGKTVENKRNLLIFSILEKKFGVNIICVERVVRMVEITSLPKSHDSILGVIDYHGTIIPILNLHHRLGLNLPQIDLKAKILILSNKGKIFGFIIENVVGVYQEDELEIVKSEKVIPGLGKSITDLAKHDDEFVMVYEIDKLLTPSQNKFMNELSEVKNEPNDE